MNISVRQTFILAMVRGKELWRRECNMVEAKRWAMDMCEKNGMDYELRVVNSAAGRIERLSDFVWHDGQEGSGVGVNYAEEVNCWYPYDANEYVQMVRGGAQ